ncbi:MAG: CZB domain-containing protein [Elusimicrobia bacterium]|nr:CZB domain-containing protein [Elusimicrobiota bacterium]MBP9699362.1 CZB domain-containing protein [Elusimicrobiota bacterium]
MKEDIDKALAAHGAWRQRLIDAIGSGKCEISVSQAQLDNVCAFGKWFYALPSGLRSEDVCGKIQKLHADFHKEAARILGLALAGKKTEAEKAIQFGTPFMDISGKLSLALNQWKGILPN